MLYLKKQMKIANILKKNVTIIDNMRYTQPVTLKHPFFNIKLTLTIT